MTGLGPTTRTRRSRWLGLLAASGVATLIACGPVSFEIPIETPIQPKLDVTPFQRVLIAGFVAGGTEDVDTNQETVRLLRSQLRSKSGLRIIDADPMPLMEIAQEQGRSGDQADASPSDGPRPTTVADRGSQPAMALPQRIREEKDLEPYERLFANTAYWKRIGEEYQNPLIVTGTVLGIRLARRRGVRLLRQAPCHPHPHLPRTEGLHPAAEVHLHRRPLGRDDVLGELSRRGALQRAADDTRAIVLLRVDGPSGAELPEHPEQPEDSRHAGPDQVSTFTRLPGPA